MRELNEVATDAAGLAEELRRAQNLPADFPAVELLDVMTQLQALPDGTAEGCRQPLEYARGRLPAVRRRFIKTETQSASLPADADAPPPLTRGMTIDQRIGALINSVTTALDEYRDLASITEDDTADTSPSRVVNTSAPDVIAAIESARNIEFALGAGVKNLETIVKPESVPGDDLKRQMRDARGLLSLARIELRMPDFVPRWYRKTLDMVRDYPGLMRKTMRGVKIGVDVAQALAEGWHKFQQGSLNAVFDGIKHAADGLIAVADTWDAERVTSQPADPPHPTEPPPGFDLREVHRRILAEEEVPRAWRPLVVELDFGWSSKYLDDDAKPDFFNDEKNRNNPLILRDLAPIAGLANLQNLNLDNTQVQDLAPITGLGKLQTLRLDNTQVQDLAAIAGLGKLQGLWLNATQVRDLAPIAGLANLQTLGLNATQVRDLAPITGLANLQNLGLDNTQVQDLAAIAGLGKLQGLWLNGTEVRDLAPIAGLANLQNLGLDNTQVQDLAPIAGLANLQALSLERTQVRDLAPIAGLANLQTLRLDGTQVRDASMLRHPIRNLRLPEGCKAPDWYRGG